MKISIRSAGVGEFTTLADEGDRTETVAEFSTTMSAGAQVAPLFRAANAAVFNRGNRFWVFDLVIERTHASLVDALAFLVTHPASLPGSVDLRIEKGATVTLAEGAVLTGLKSDTRGLSTAFLYQFTASDYVLAPDPEP